VPNYCNNTLTLRHADPDKIQQVVSAFNGDRLLDHFVPMPAELNDTAEPGDDYVARAEAIRQRNQELHGYDDWYGWRLDHWGTKWDISCDDVEPAVSDDGLSVFLSFDTAWSPPTAWYHEMVDQHGFDVQATFFEPGAAFIGRYTTENLEEIWEYAGESREWIRQNIPAELRDEHDIETWLLDEEEDDDDDESEYPQDDVDTE
jgi:hypothetical protein